MGMKTPGIIFLLLFIIITSANGQRPFGKGRYEINGGIGFSDWGIPFYGGVDFGVHKDISAGLEGSFRTYNEDYTGTIYNSTIYGITGNSNYHFDTLIGIPWNWDLYAGINLGYYYWSIPRDYPGNSSSGVGFGAQIGGRYFFSEVVGLNLEFSLGNSFSGGKIGITYIIGKNP
jgi:outer membrane immunogenic protein